MLVGRIQGFTRDLGRPEGWDEARDGLCGSLPIKDEPYEGGLNQMISAWEPTPEELERLALGAPVLLRVVGVVHPPVMMTVGKVPE